MTLAPRAVIVSRPTEYDLLLDRHGTRQQVAFFLEERHRDLVDVMARHEEQQEAMQAVTVALPMDWRRANVGRRDLDRWLFAPEDIVVAVGQDGLVANVAKYLNGQLVVGVNPSAAGNSGVLVPIDPSGVADVFDAIDAGRKVAISERAMVRIVADTGRGLTALNEVFVGQRTHQSARYTLTVEERSEFQSSSGLLVSTGTGSTGWTRSLWTERQCAWALPAPDSQSLSWFVREAWPSPSTGTTLVEGVLTLGRSLTVTAASDALVAFGDGIEADRIELSWGQSATISLADRRLRLLQAVA